MTLCSTVLLGVLFLGSPCGQADPEAPNPDDRQAGRERSRDARREPGERRRGARRPGRNRGDRSDRRRRFRERQQAYLRATPDERKDMRVDRWLDMTTRTYELDDSQKETVRAEIKAMQTERRQAMGPMADEYDKLRVEMMEQYARNMGSDEAGPERWRSMRDDPEIQRIRERMNEIEAAYPFDMEAAGRRIEKLLPEDQVKKGRERIAEWQERRKEWQKRREERRRERERDGDRSDRRRRADGDAAGKADAELRKAEADAAAEQDRVAREQAAAADAAVAARTAGPVHAWELYVRQFIDKHKLTESQRTAAMAILKDSRLRATQYEQSVEKRKAEAAKIPDKVAREESLKKLSEPVNELFEELKLRLDGLLTAKQRGDYVA